MTRYSFWNNKGGTGKTSLIFQTVLEHARRKQGSKILVIDLCPQANLSDLLFGGMMGKGSRIVEGIHRANPRKSVGGYFQERISTPYTVPKVDLESYISKPSEFNEDVPQNIDLLAGDQLVEVQTNSIATLSNTTLPGLNPWLSVIDWINDFINASNNIYKDVFIDTNPSFSIYTQIAIAATDKLILPVMADDSSKRAIQNVFSLVHGIEIPEIYQGTAFSKRLADAGRPLPLIHIIIKNRLTQYMGPASAYQSIFKSIDNYILELVDTNPDVFTFDDYKQEGVVEVRDFQTTGVVAFAQGLPFRKTTPGKHQIFDKSPQVNADFLDSCIRAIDEIVDKL